MFTVFFELQAFPAEVPTLLFFIEFLALSFRSPKSITNVLASVKLFHERQGLGLEQFGALRLRLALRALGRTLRHHPVQAAPLPASLLAPLVRVADSLGGWALAFKALVLFAFFTFARLSSLVPPRQGEFDPSRWPTVGDLVVGQSGASLRIKYSKTRQTADAGFRVPFRASGVLPCPVQAARAVLLRAHSLHLPPSAPLFAGFHAGSGEFVSLTQPRARAMLAGALRVLRLPRGAFSFHSFRRGGCSHAFAQGASESDLALHGDWRSVAIRQYYPAGLARDRVAKVLTQGGPPSPSQFFH